jgi:hypothetical protein
MSAEKDRVELLEERKVWAETWLTKPERLFPGNTDKEYFERVVQRCIRELAAIKQQ